MSLAELARFGTKVEADLAGHKLDAEGIDHVILDGGMNNVFGGAGLIAVRLMVLEEDLTRAREALSRS
ncbi:putative signal transducing protein [Sphingomicrobium lutaoense]|uniref:DUF2007 domain-containing protein n=1 Tax=Sphingomicrobium lutaoense TaxID=515949 RepID=A0A839Z0F3_9SPHN|nr:DUF2007 domain-containing protein [Sphingomicrobium lutaoense]MBB3764746.1 hypothetical protein [Sphingomicrobium lutaoense]